MKAYRAKRKRHLIALDIHTVGQRQTGNETYIRNLLENYSSIKSPWDYLLYHTTQIPPDVASKWRGTLRPIAPHAAALRIPVSLPIALSLDGVDLAHFQYVSPPLCPCPTVLTVHDISYEFHPEYFHPLQRARMRLLIPQSARRAAHVFTISNYSRDTIVSEYGLPETKVTVTYIGVSPEYRHLPEDECRPTVARLGISRPYILGVGNLQPRKNLERLVQAYSQLVNSTHCDHLLVLVGQNAWQGNRVKEEAHRLGVLDRVLFTGYVTEQELVALYNRATVFAYPSLFEGFGLPIIEAMACGTATLTSNVTAMPEVAGDAAMLVSPTDVDAIADGLTRLIERDDLRNELVRRGYRRASLFDWRVTAINTLRVYGDVLGIDMVAQPTGTPQ